jgi:hypothetical protein
MVAAAITFLLAMLRKTTIRALWMRLSNKLSDRNFHLSLELDHTRTGRKGTEPAGLSRSFRPILQPKVLNPAEFADIVGYESHAQAECMGRDHQIVSSDY